MSKKNPTQTKENLLLAATKLIVQHGAANLTLDAIAAESGVSKGGLLHHFPTKDTLLRELLIYHTAIFDARLARELETEPKKKRGRWARAYIRASLNPDPGEMEIGWALASIVTADPELIDLANEGFRNWERQSLNDGLAPARATAIRLACDGYWLGELGGTPTMDDGSKLALTEELTGWTK
jgi:AcrR family transcriptional regulator